MIEAVLELASVSSIGLIGFVTVIGLSGAIAFSCGRDVWNGRFLKLAAVYCGISIFGSAVRVLGSLLLWLMGSSP